MNVSKVNVLMLGDSHVHWLSKFVAAEMPLCQQDLAVSGCEINYRGVRGGTVTSLRNDAILGLRASGPGQPDVVIIHAGGNDIDNTGGDPPQLVGMHLYTLARDMVLCGVKHVIVCQVIRRNSWRHLTYSEGATRVSCINEFLLAACSGLQSISFWQHRGMWQEGAQIFRRDGVHFNGLGNFKLYKSVRGALHKAVRVCNLPA